MRKNPLHTKKGSKLYLLPHAGIAVLFTFLFLFFPISSAFGKESPEKRKNAVVRAVEKVGSAVVNINTEETVRRPRNPFYSGRDDFFRNFFRDFSPRFREQKKQSLGSGVIIDSRGYILTNHHVIARASRIKVSLIDKREFEAELIGADPRSDIAVIKIVAEERFPFIKMGRSDDLMIGESIIAIGNPFGLSHTVTTGVISAVGRDIMTQDNKTFTDFIQLDASINPGNSGGPLLNIEGSLIGINTAIFRKAEGIGFAIPIDRAERIVKELIQYGKVHQVWLGLFVQDMDANIASYFDMKPGHGVLVSKVFKGGPAEEAGIQQGDIILETGGKRVISKHGYFDVLSASSPDESLSLVISRDKRILEKDVVARKIPEGQAKEIVLDWLGFDVGPITKSVYFRFKLQTDSGVLVTNVIPGGAAAGVGIRPGDVVKQINRKKIATMSDFKKAVVGSLTKYSVLLLVQRGPNGYYVTLEP